MKYTAKIRFLSFAIVVCMLFMGMSFPVSATTDDIFVTEEIDGTIEENIM